MAASIIPDTTGDFHAGEISWAIENANAQSARIPYINGVFKDGYPGLSDQRLLDIFAYAMDAKHDHPMHDPNFFNSAISTCLLSQEIMRTMDELDGKYSGNTKPIAFLILAMQARQLIDFARLGVVPRGVQETRVSLKQMALLCGISQAGLRNALSKDEKRPPSEKSGRTVMLAPLDAHEWMSCRPGYSATYLLPSDPKFVEQFIGSFSVDPLPRGA
jgi:hypothetical protein